MPSNFPFTTPQHSPEELVGINQHRGPKYLVTATHFEEVVYKIPLKNFPLTTYTAILDSRIGKNQPTQDIEFTSLDVTVIAITRYKQLHSVYIGMALVIYHHCL